MRSAIYESTVTHQRFEPVSHRLRYGVYSLLIDLDEREDLGATVRGWSWNRFNLVSFHDRDHGPRDGSDLRAWFDDEAYRAGIDLTGGKVHVLAFPRILGFVFNPITVWFGYDQTERLRFVLYEVHNTFGDEHRYGFVVPDDVSPGTVPPHRVDKRFHVSPFLDRDGWYRMRLHAPNDRYRLVIDLFDDAGSRLLTATQSGRRRPLTTSGLLRQFMTKPLLTLKVIGGIHLEALRLWSKGVDYRSSPVPLQPITDYASPISRDATGRP
ncbi:MAG: DUF1365 domain-containing protein [Acidimicrobiia bacterium]|nr:DUF1365 domain-containing protein [Acidimicrobiia bacterium]